MKHVLFILWCCLAAVVHVQSGKAALNIPRLANEVSMVQQNNGISTWGESTSRVYEGVSRYGGGALVLTLCVCGVFFYRGYRKRKEQLLQAEFQRQVAQVEMQALRAQMNPHFIFNCLNSINSSIIRSDSITATGYLTKFSKLIRLMLDNSAAQATTLDSELQLLRLYIEMELLRYDDHFSWEMEIDKGLDVELVEIPSMIIQPYVENAIWHGLMHQKKAGKLQLQVKQCADRMLEVVVEDNGIGRIRAAEINGAEMLSQKSYGMRITRDRLYMISNTYQADADVSVEDLALKDGSAGGTRVTVHIPFRHIATKGVV